MIGLYRISKYMGYGKRWLIFVPLVNIVYIARVVDGVMLELKEYRHTWIQYGLVLWSVLFSLVWLLPKDVVGLCICYLVTIAWISVLYIYWTLLALTCRYWVLALIIPPPLMLIWASCCLDRAVREVLES